ncbi:mitochondrial processing peptidase, partial [Toxoplasma gondii p89]
MMFRFLPRVASGASSLSVSQRRLRASFSSSLQSRGFFSAAPAAATAGVSPLARSVDAAIPEEAFNQPPTLTTTLPNGIRVATQRLPFHQTATVGVWIDSGSRYDTKETNGAAHFLEHMTFKVRKKGRFSQSQGLRFPEERRGQSEGLESNSNKRSKTWVPTSMPTRPANRQCKTQ